MKIEVRERNKDRQKKIRVAAYCRVSTEHDDQEDSLENQKSTYEKEIRSNPAYEFAGIYYDFGISGYKDERPGFQALLRDARDGKIDLILTKSISRFARNTQIVLKATRELKSLGIGVFFELQGINTLTSEGELMMTVVAAFAQAESEGISEVAKMAYRRKYEAGIPVQYLERSFGYRKDKDGKYAIDENEAVWVRKIFQMVADGYTIAAVKRHLNESGIRTVSGAKWVDSTVSRIVENEIYKGDYIMHKHFVNSERKLVPNRGEVDSWYITDDHIPIVSRKLWQKAQDAIRERRGYLAEGSCIDEDAPYKNKLFCALCGYPLYPRIYSNGNRMNWGCSAQKRFGKQFCTGVNVPDGTVRRWDFEGNIYIFEKNKERGIREFGFYAESYWRRSHKKKRREKMLPALNKQNYPYYKKIRCAKCGYRLTRHTASTNSQVTWICSGYKHKGSSFCEGVRIPDEQLREWMPIGADIYISERKDANGSKHYSYTSQAERDKGR